MIIKPACDLTIIHTTRNVRSKPQTSTNVVIFDKYVLPTGIMVRTT